MKKSLHFAALFIGLLLQVLPSEGQAAPRRKKSSSKSDSSDEKILGAVTTQKKIRVKGETSGLSGIIGGEYGVLKATPKDTATFEPKNGTALELKLLSGWLFSDFMVDSGLGFYYYKVRGKEYPLVNGERIDGDRELAVSGLLFEFSPSYRLTDELFSGGVLQFRTPGYASYYSDADPSSLLFSVGGQLGFQFFDRELNSRITLKAITNLGLSGWSDIAYLGGVQFGLPFRQPDSLVIRKTTVVNKLRDVVEYRKKDFTITVSANVIKLALDNILTFYVDPSGRPTLTAEAQSFLVDLGASLSSNLSLFEVLRIDAQSPEHITTVHDSLISIGVVEAKIKKGKSLQAIADGGNASVDFTFSGVKDANTLAERIRAAMKSARIPENCNKNGTCE
jgi:hypothetical protein